MVTLSAVLATYSTEYRNWESARGEGQCSPSLFDKDILYGLF